MKIVGIDPSSSICGVALIEDNNLLFTDAWFKDKNKSHPDRLVEYFIWLQTWLSINEPDIAVIEFLSVTRNAEATRVIAFYQAVSALVCKLRGILVVEARVTSARKATLGKGNMAKEDVYKEMKKRYPNNEWKSFTKGGADEADALVMALSYMSLVER